jgi:hypothetical protein
MNLSNHYEQVDYNIPLLLAGPIVRRVEKSKIFIWISTSKNVQAKIRIFRIVNSTSKSRKYGNPNEDMVPCQNDRSSVVRSNLQLIGEGINSPLQLGDNLFINLIKASPLKSLNGNNLSKSAGNLIEFPTNELLAYDLELISPTSETGTCQTISLKDLGLLAGENSIVYGHHTAASLSQNSYTNGNYQLYYPALPMLYIPDSLQTSSLNLLYGSCRKLHGDDEDSLIIGDKLMQDFGYNLDKRPGALFLMGDQIYADDVAGPLITFIKKLSSKLLGWKEGINGVDRKLGDLNIGERKDIVSKFAKFSTDVGDNHLLGFGEFAAMYLIAWNQLLWPKEFDQHPMNELIDSTSRKKKYLNELRALEQIRQTLAGIRRLLANIPTYMICDDHEITDDWNINKKWCDDIDQSICGKQVISNGLIAFWAFQAWGNDPESFDENFIQKVKQYLNLNKESSESFLQINHKPTVNSSEVSLKTKDEIAILRTKQDQQYRFIMSANWTYVTPTYPLSIFLDCRTQRTFGDEEGPPDLLSDKALDNMKSMLIKSGYKNGDPIILISPTPVFGFELAEGIQGFLTSISGSYKWDLETWRANEKGFVKFLTYLANNFNPSCCIFLSGDVHYAFTMKARLEHLKLIPKIGSSIETNSINKIRSAIQIVQLTSSPLRSNHLTNRIAAILILNLVHKIIVTKNFLLRKALSTKDTNSGAQKMNYDYFRRLPDIYYHETESTTLDNHNNSNQKKIHFSKHSKDKSLLEKISVIAFNLIIRYFKTNKYDKNLADSPWAELRLLIKPKGQGSFPVLARNNIGYVHLNLNSKSVEHTLYFLDKGSIRNHQAYVQFP